MHLLTLSSKEVNGIIQELKQFDFYKIAITCNSEAITVKNQNNEIVFSALKNGKNNWLAKGQQLEV